jgi:hypothetical protein
MMGAYEDVVIQDVHFLEYIAPTMHTLNVGYIGLQSLFPPSLAI